ncbi:STAS domain-containing protein [Chlamydiota bacterium]
MQNQAIAISIKKEPITYTLVALSQRISFDTSSEIEKKLYMLLDSGHRKIVINCQHLVSIDMQVVGLLLGFHRNIISSDGNLIFCNMNNRIHETITQLGLSSIFHISANESEAVEFLKTE